MLIKFKIILLFLFSLLFSQEDGYDLYKNKNYDAAIQYYDNLINSNKKVPEANYGKGSSSYMQGDYDSALKSLDKALSTDESDLKNKIYYNIGNTYYKKNDSKKALEFFKKALKENPKDDFSRYNYEFLKYMDQQDQQEMSNEELQDLERAENILNAMKEDEQIMQKKKLMKMKSKKFAKDW